MGAVKTSKLNTEPQRLSELAASSACGTQEESIWADCVPFTTGHGWVITHLQHPRTIVLPLCLEELGHGEHRPLLLSLLILLFPALYPLGVTTYC